MANIVKFSPILKELRVHLCPISPGCNGVRDFVKKLYVPLKKANPNFPILIRECQGVQPKLWARYDFGKEACVSLKDLKAEEVMKKIVELNCKN
ncbi:NADH dehydrogenase (ubiquinone) B8 subunit [Rhodnius prolixus]|uniref:NADH dehydrogenase [ubiquinone] 1 alpha subcomplex subunit 2 n=2 Tax=Rhodnius TaxID=13248 RepID=A0A4P6DHA7_RHOPR